MVVVVAGAVGVFVLANGEDDGEGDETAGMSPTMDDTETSEPDASEPDSAKDLPGEEFSDPQGSYKLNVDPAWPTQHGTITTETEVWMVGEPSADFVANINVMTQVFDGDLETYLDVTKQQLDLHGDFTPVDDQLIEGPSGQALGVLEYTGSQQGYDLRFLVTFFVDDGQAVFATFTEREDEYAEQREAVEPYLLTLRPE